MQNEKIHACITLCWACRHECQTTLFNHCLKVGGEHAEAAHVKIMIDCMEICQSAADFMTRGSEFHAATCIACADVCEACAYSCEQIGGEEMIQCAEICRQCAQHCRAMGNARNAA